MRIQTVWLRLVLISTLATTMLTAVPALATTMPGTLIKTKAYSDIYYVGSDGKRYVFPSAGVYFSWYKKTSPVKVLTSAEMSALQIGGNVTFKPGAKLVRIQPDSKIYVVSKGGTLRYVANEDVAAALYGANWKQMVDAVDPAEYVNYQVGSVITTAAQFDKASEATAVTSINSDRTFAATSAGTSK